MEDVWQEWSLATSPQISPDLVIAGRTKEVKQIHEWIASRSGMLSVQGDSPDEPLAFLYAAVDKLPEKDKTAALSRCVVVDNVQEFRAIQAYNPPLIIAAPGECVGAAGAALAKGHQVYIRMDATGVNIGSNFLKLSRPQRESVETALRQSSVSALEAQKLSRDFGRSIPVIRRNLSISNVVRNPVWSSPEAADSLLPALLAGSWSEEKEGDRKVLETLASVPYEQFSKKLTPFLSVEDTPLRKVGAIWAFKSPLDAWYLLARHLSNPLLDFFKQVVHSVLTETDPKYELSPENRWAAAIYGKVSQFSEWLRSGLVDSLVLLAVYGDRSPHVKS
ncbi:MAG TPA: hypothetical protein VFA15_04000, partial [Nitrososphaera sp.]|nr:hypothetical protein [Nitrososphaera sp.]